MSTSYKLRDLSQRLRVEMSQHQGDLEAAVKALLAKRPEDASLLQQLLEGAQAAQDRQEHDPVVAAWLRKTANAPRMRHLATTLQGLDSAMSSSIMGGIAQRRPDLAEALKNAIFQFSDLMYADQKGLQRLVSKLPRETILLSLRGLEGPLKDRLMASLSTRVRAEILDELSWMTPVRRSKIEEARRQVVSTARESLASGEMFLRRPNDPDPYID